MMILFVCAGNICRSVALQAVAEKLMPEVFSDSCGIDATFIGANPDSRMMESLQSAGYEIEHNAKLFEPSFLGMYDCIFPVTTQIESYLRTFANDQEKQKIMLATTFTTKEDIPDPYLVGGFDHVLDLSEKAVKGIKNFLFSF